VGSVFIICIKDIFCTSFVPEPTSNIQQTKAHVKRKWHADVDDCVNVDSTVNHTFYMTFREVVAWNIDELIRKRGKSKKGLSEEIGCGRALIQAYAKGDALPSLENLKKLCVALDCRYEDILGAPNE